MILDIPKVVHKWNSYYLWKKLFNKTRKNKNISKNNHKWINKKMLFTIFKIRRYKIKKFSNKTNNRDFYLINKAN